jgi:hypothetical protein
MSSPSCPRSREARVQHGVAGQSFQHGCAFDQLPCPTVGPQRRDDPGPKRSGASGLSALQAMPSVPRDLYCTAPIDEGASDILPAASGFRELEVLRKARGRPEAQVRALSRVQARAMTVCSYLIVRIGDIRIAGGVQRRGAPLPGVWGCPPISYTFLGGRVGRRTLRL